MKRTIYDNDLCLVEGGVGEYFLELEDCLKFIFLIANCLVVVGCVQ